MLAHFPPQDRQRVELEEAADLAIGVRSKPIFPGGAVLEEEAGLLVQPQISIDLRPGFVSRIIPMIRGIRELVTGCSFFWRSALREY
jgi:hypothetical protein